MGIKAKFLTALALFAFVVGAASWLALSMSHAELIELEARRMADVVTTQILVERATYADAVVDKLEQDDVGAARDAHERPGYIMLPDQFVRAVSKGVDAGATGLYRYRSISEWNLNPAQGLGDTFDRLAWTMLKEQADEFGGEYDGKPRPWAAVSRIATVDGERVFQYVRADPAAKRSCTTCHNDYERNHRVHQMRTATRVEPGKQWQQHELMGALRVDIPLKKVEALAATGRTRLLTIGGPVLLVGVALLAWLVHASVLSPMRSAVQDVEHFNKTVALVVDQAKALAQSTEAQLKTIAAESKKAGQARTVRETLRAKRAENAKRARRAVRARLATAADEARSAAEAAEAAQAGQVRLAAELDKARSAAEDDHARLKAELDEVLKRQDDTDDTDDNETQADDYGIDFKAEDVDDGIDFKAEDDDIESKADDDDGIDFKAEDDDIESKADDDDGIDFKAEDDEVGVDSKAEDDDIDAKADDDIESKADDDIESKADDDIESKADDDHIDGKAEDNDIESKADDDHIESKADDDDIESKADDDHIDGKAEDNDIESKADDDHIESKADDDDIESKADDDDIDDPDDPEEADGFDHAKIEDNAMDNASVAEVAAAHCGELELGLTTLSERLRQLFEG